MGANGNRREVEGMDGKDIENRNRNRNRAPGAHMHTILRDIDSTPVGVCQWYR
jgi:hypothetical protein